MVEAVDEDNPHKVSTESKKKRWALFIYIFSNSRNFREIFSKPYKTIRDRKFEVFDGLRVQMIGWIILGHVYLLGRAYGYSTTLLKQEVLEGFFPMVILSADFAISTLYFISGFIGMFALIKKFQKSNENLAGVRREHNSVNSDTSTTMNIPRLSKRALCKQILARWLRLAFPIYFVVAVALGILPFLT